MRLAFMAMLSLWLSACQAPSAHYQFANARPQPLSAQATNLLGAAVEADITPPPGLPKAGFATWAEYGDGFRTRLKARVFYLRRKGGEPLVLVQTDLLAGPKIMHVALSQRLAAVSEIALQNLVITANHTHAAPGQHPGSTSVVTFTISTPAMRRVLISSDLTFSRSVSKAQLCRPVASRVRSNLQSARVKSGDKRAIARCPLT
jgi:hypothetical protein